MIVVDTSHRLTQFSISPQISALSMLHDERDVKRIRFDGIVVIDIRAIDSNAA